MEPEGSSIVDICDDALESLPKVAEQTLLDCFANDGEAARYFLS